MEDYGGTADRLDLRPFAFDDVSFVPFDSDGDGAPNTLEIYEHGGGPNVVTVIGHYSPTARGQQSGRMEQIIFSDRTVTGP